MSNLHEYLVTIYGLEGVRGQYGASVKTIMKDRWTGMDSTDWFPPAYSVDALAKKLALNLTHARDVAGWDTLSEPTTLEGRAIVPVSADEVEEVKNAYLIAYENRVLPPGWQVPPRWR